MSATATYKQFLASPSAAALTPAASLYYVTTGTSFIGADEIMKHLASLRPLIKKKKEDILCSIEGSGAIAAEVDTEIEFLLSGAAYLPGMDENFLSDRTVSLPIMHIVVFEANRISQIRLTWDQGALLKQLDVIGKTGRNWPIRESKEQLSIITACLRQVAASATGSNGNGNGNGSKNDSRARDNSNGCFIHSDPHASLVLFGPHEEIMKLPSVVSPYAGTRPAQRSFTDIISDQPSEQPSAVISPYGGQRPKQRSFQEILGDEGDEGHDPPSPSEGRGRPGSSGGAAIAPKAGSSKHFAPSRLFDGVEHVESDEEDSNAINPPRFTYRPNPSKYEHFELTDGSDPAVTPKPGVPLAKQPKTMNNSNSSWSFDDHFTTPAKPQMSKAYRHQDRHWDMENDEIRETPNPRTHAPPRPRPDVDAHFNMRDDSNATPRGPVHDQRHMYEHSIDSQATAEPGPHALSTITNLQDRQQNPVPHIDTADGPPTPKQYAPAGRGAAAENANERGINIAGDGMGGRKGTSRTWLYGSDTAPIEKMAVAGDGMGGRRGREKSWMHDNQSEQEDISHTRAGLGARKGADLAQHKNFGSHFSMGDESPAAKENTPVRRVAAAAVAAADATAERGADDRGINIAGDGMGGRKGTDRGWFYGDESSSPPKAVPGKKFNTSMATTSSLSWDF